MVAEPFVVVSAADITGLPGPSVDALDPPIYPPGVTSTLAATTAYANRSTFVTHSRPTGICQGRPGSVERTGPLWGHGPAPWGTLGAPDWVTPQSEPESPLW